MYLSQTAKGCVPWDVPESKGTGNIEYRMHCERLIRTGIIVKMPRFTIAGSENDNI